MNWIVKIIQGVLIGAGGVLPGVSGGVLAVLFGVYKPLMRLLAHPFKELKNSVRELWPIIVGFFIGYIGIAKVLASVLENYQEESLAVFVGMAIGIMPSLFREAGEKGRNRNSWLSLAGVFAVSFTLLYVCNFVLQLTIVPNFGWNMFGGACLALSIIAPGMSASVLMLPLKTASESGTPGVFYEHITGAIGDIVDNPDFVAIAAILLGAVAAFILLTRAVDWMMNKHYSVMFHGVIGLVIAASIFTIPFEAFGAGVLSCITMICYVVIGCCCTLLLDIFNSSVEKPPVD